MDQVVEAKQTSGNRLRRGAQPMSVELLKELLYLTAIFILPSPKKLVYKYLEDKWTYSYIDKLQDFVNRVSSRTNRVIKLAPNKVTKNDVLHLTFLRAEQLLKVVRDQSSTLSIL